MATKSVCFIGGVVVLLLSLVSMATFSSASASIPIDLKLSITDQHGQSIESADTGDSVLVRSDITSNLAIGDSFIHVLQIKDPQNRVVFLSSTTFELQAISTESLSSSWTSENSGLYDIQALVWPNVQSPSSITFTANRIQVDDDPRSGTEYLGSASCFSGVVTRVIDGDTIDVGNVTVRFTLVDTAERGQANYDEAKQFTSLHCAVGSKILVDEDDGQTSGSFGRMIAKVYCDERSINEQLLESGNAIILVQHCGESEFADESWARNYGC